MRWSWLVVLLVVRVASAGDVVRWPSPLPERAWRVGQWLHYAAPGRDEYVTVVGEDACGTWIEWTVVTGKTWTRHTTCFDEAERVAKVVYSQSDAPPVVVDGRDLVEIRLRGLVTPPASFGTDHADIDVPAGRFEQAVHEAHDPSIWFHPAVPLAGLIKSGDFELVGFGTSRAVARDLGSLDPRPAWTTPPTFVAIGFGWDRVSGRDGMPAETGFGARLDLGYRVARRTDVLLTMAGTNGQDESVMQAVIGVRWSPFRASADVLPERIERAAVFVQGQFGYTGLTRGGEHAGSGIGLALRFGWLPLRRLDWAMGFALGGDVGFYSAGEGHRGGVSFATVFQLFGI